MTRQDKNEQFLLSSFLYGGNASYIEDLYNRYKTMIYSVGMAICGNPSDADEVVQETFLRTFPKMDQWRGESRFSTWLYVAAVRTAQNWKARFMRNRGVVARVPAGPAEERSENRDRLMAAIRALPEQQRTTLMLKHLQGLRVREIATLQGCAEGTVKANLHHAVRALLRRLGPEPEEA